MKNLSQAIIILFLLSILNLSVSLYSFNELNKREYIVQIEMDNILNMEAKLEDLYLECKARDTVIYRMLLDMRNGGLDTIDLENKIAELQ